MAKVTHQSIDSDLRGYGNIKTDLEKLNDVESSLTQKVQQSDISETGRKIKIVACVLRNDGSGWRFIDTDNGQANHSHINVQSVTADTSNVNLNFSFNAKNILSFVACPDETFANLGYFIGSSVGTNYANIQIYQAPKVIESYIVYNGTSWTVSQNNSGITAGAFNAGVLTLNHEYFDTSYAVSATGRGGKYNVQIGSVANNTTNIEFYDFTGNLVTTPTTNMKFFFQRSKMQKVLNPQNITSASGNIWCLGVFEV